MSEFNYLHYIDKHAREWDLYKTKEGFYNISILMTDKPKDWKILRGYKSASYALAAGRDYIKQSLTEDKQ